MPHNIRIVTTVEKDLDSLFEFQLDPEAIHLAAFTSKDPTDKNAYLEKFRVHIKDPSINMRTIFLDGKIIGSLAKFIMFGDAEITYWIDKKYWGQGIATQALQEFLRIETTRPLYGRVAFDNIGSRKVLEKCGFIKTGTDKGFANARQEEVEEIIYMLEK